MVPRGWSGFLRGLAAAIAATACGRPSDGDAAAHENAPWQRAAARRRRALLGGVITTTCVAVVLMIATMETSTPAWLKIAIPLLLAMLTAWVAAGFFTALMGLFVACRKDPHAISAADVRGTPLKASSRTAIIMPICNEQVTRVFAGLRATCESLARTGHGRQFDVFVLSDSSDPDTCTEELSAWRILRSAMSATLPVYYRRRQRRVRRKVGNVSDFCRRWGSHYDYLIVLDADSVMSGDCLVNLVKLMDRHPRAGIIQTAPATDGMDTLHARAQQFSGRVAGRLFASGMSYWQLGESHYWGHNAILRTEPFIRHCALARLPGTGGLSGDILSHDFVEAALMRRAGFEVWLVSDLDGSYEQQPPNLTEELRRERRWCQGNLMNLRLVAEPGFATAHRWMLFTGALSYFSSPLWLLFLALSAAFWQVGDGWSNQTLALSGMAAALVLAPKAMAVGLICLKGEVARHGGWMRLLGSAVLEAAWSIAHAPVRMAAHTLFCIAALTGLEVRWQSPPREAAEIDARAALGQFSLFSVLAVAITLWAMLSAPAVAVWLLPVTLPLLASPWLAMAGSRSTLGRTARRYGLLCTPEERVRPEVLQRTERLARISLKLVTIDSEQHLPANTRGPQLRNHTLPRCHS